MHTVYQFHSGPLPIHPRVFSRPRFSFTVAIGLLPSGKKSTAAAHSAPHSFLEVAGPTGNIWTAPWRDGRSGFCQGQTCTVCNNSDSCSLPAHPHFFFAAPFPPAFSACLDVCILCTHLSKGTSGAPRSLFAFYLRPLS